MEEQKPLNAILRHKGRKYPYITIIYSDQSSKSLTIRADLKTAEKILFKIKREIALGKFDLGRYVDDHQQGITMAEFQGRFLEHREKLVHIGQISTATYEHDKLSLSILLRCIAPNLQIKNLDRDSAINFIVLLKDSITQKGKTFKPGAINSYLRNIKTAFNWAVREKLIHENPWKEVSRLPDPASGTFRYLEEGTIERIREYLADKPEWQLDVFNLSLWTGARRGEIFNLTKQNLFVDLIKGEKVPFARLTGKGNRSRNMPLCAEACQLLDRRVKYLDDAEKQFEIIDRSKVPSQDDALVQSRLKQGFIFWEITDIQSITKAFGRARRVLGIAYFNAHSLRHSFATYCLKDDIPITTVKEFLGHRDIGTTMIYAKTDDEVKARDIRKMKAR
jgi:integrase/recombinase XerD